MKLITKAIEKMAPELAETEMTPTGEVMAVAKFFDPTGRYTFWMTEYDRTNRMAFGYCLSPIDPDFDELGYVSISELESVKGALGLGIERDRHFSPKPLGKAVEELTGSVPKWMTW
jgi:hypothetical protein